jgi:hypothetical protein
MAIFFGLLREVGEIVVKKIVLIIPVQHPALPKIRFNGPRPYFFGNLNSLPNKKLK